MSIILEIKESAYQVLSGIPEYVEVTSSVPSTVFYSLDGTTPDENSYIATGKIYLPTEDTSFTLKIIAISGSKKSSIFEAEYSTSKVDVDRAWTFGSDRITIIGYDDDDLESVSFDSSGEPSQESSIEFESLDIKASTTDRHGYPIPGGSSSHMVMFPEIKGESKKPFQGKGSSTSDINFDPKAGLIIVDGRTEQDYDGQEVRVINRSSGTFTVSGEYWNEHLNGGSIVSGNLVRSMYNPKNNTMISYYYESRENRWIESRQSVSVGSKKFTPILKEGGGCGIVFRWVDSRYSSRLY